MQYTTHRPQRVGIQICVAKDGAGSVMGTDVTSVIGCLDFRVLIEPDDDYGVWVARCIDTNAVATGATPEEAEELIKQVLENDIRIAVREGSIKNLVRARSPFDVIERWHLVQKDSPGSVRKVTLDVPGDVAPTPRRSVQSELKIISRRKDGTA